jgi:hypothetical protein
MIGFNALGQLGRLGNQMFQYASLKGIARRNGYEYCIPPSQNKDEWREHQLFVPFKLESLSSLNVQFIDVSRPIIAEETFSFNEKIFNECSDWVSLQGYFQSEKYFKHIEDEIRFDFAFKDEILEPCKEMISQLDTSPISLHVRRTDYVTNPNHTALELDYYQKALEKFDNELVLVFSDDPNWCSQQELFSSDRFLIAEGNSNYVDLCLMTLCSGHIIANSSFSWWGAWLANSKQVVAPSGWFAGSNNEHLDIKDLILETWMVIK